MQSARVRSFSPFGGAPELFPVRDFLHTFYKKSMRNIYFKMEVDPGFRRDDPVKFSVSRRIITGQAIRGRVIPSGTVLRGAEESAILHQIPRQDRYDNRQVVGCSKYDIL